MMKPSTHTSRTHNRQYLNALLSITTFSFVLLSHKQISNLLDDYSVRRHLAYLQSAKPLSDFERLKHITEVCGPLCDPQAGKLVHASNSNCTYRYVPVDRQRCRALYSSPYMFAPLASKVAPRTIPPELINAFTMTRRYPIYYEYKNDVYLGNKLVHRVWSREFIAESVQKVHQGKLDGTYGKLSVSELFRLVRYIGVKDKRVLIVGSQKPWVEAVVLAAGARETVTLEFAQITCEDPRMKAYTPAMFSALVLANKMPSFDFIVSYSSYEHSGLGRYGDSLNPFGDVIAVGMAWCVAAKNAQLVLEVPRAGSDVLKFNVHKYYGPLRLPFLTTNWKPVDIDDRNWSPVLRVLGDLARPMVFTRME